MFLLNFFKNDKVQKSICIFLVGLVSRTVINYAYDLSVFEEYANNISLIYYACMAGFSVFVSDLPGISLKVLDFKGIKSVIKVFLSQTVHMSAPQPIGGVALFNQVLLLHPYI